MFWYTGKYFDASKFSEVYAAQMVFNTHFNLLAKVAIIGASHFISFFSHDKPIGCEVMTHFWPETISLKPNLFFTPDKEIYFKDANWEIFASPLNQREIQGALSQKNSLSHKFKDNNLTVVNWILEENKIIFVTLHTDTKQNLSIWSRSEYGVLSSMAKKTSNKIDEGNQEILK